MNIQTASSGQSMPAAAVAEIQMQLQAVTPKLVLFFASAQYDPVLVSREMKAAFPDATVLGCTTAGEIISGNFMSHPLGLIAGGEPFIRSPQHVDGSSLVFYCDVLEGTSLSLLESGDIVQDTREALAQREKTFGPITGIVNFHCVLRTLALQQSGQIDAYARLFQDVPTIGFSTYGEQYLGHINQTSTMLLFGGSTGNHEH
jgi:hypothetical protein